MRSSPEQRGAGRRGALLQLSFSVHGRRKQQVDSWSLPQRIVQQISARRPPPPSLPPPLPPPLRSLLAGGINHLLSRLAASPPLYFHFFASISPLVVVHRDADPSGLGRGRAPAWGQLWQQRQRQRQFGAVAWVRLGRRKHERRRGGQHGGRRSRGGWMYGWRRRRKQLGRHSKGSPVSLLELGESALHHR